MTTGSSSGSAVRPRRAARTSASSGASSRSTSRCSRTSPRTTSPSSPLSAPTARALLQHQRRRGRRRGREALRAYKVIFLTDVAGWLPIPPTPRAYLGGERASGRRLPTSRAACARSSRLLDAIEGGVPRPHRRRPRAAFAAARALHRRRAGHDDRTAIGGRRSRSCRRSSARTRSAPTSATRSSSSAAPGPGCGTPRATSTSTSSPGSRSSTSATATRGWSPPSASRRRGSPT